MRVGYHVQADTPAPANPCTAATFLDVGGYGIAERCAERACRLYFMGRPDPSGIASRARQWVDRGQRVILGNEPNLTDEGFGGGPADYAAWFLDVVNQLDPSVRCYYAGMSPSGNWQEWYTHPLARSAIARAAGICVHTYGDLDGLIDIAWWVHDQFPDKPLWISEWNWGAGRYIADVDAWVDATVEPFLDWCASVPQIEAATWFSYWWDQSGRLPTSVNAEGTSIQRAIESWSDVVKESSVLYGVDVSNNQGIIDWDAVAATVPKISFAFLKMSGDERGQTDTMFIDGTFPRNLNECLRVGIVPFGYHFSNPDLASPVSAIATMKVSLARVGGLPSGCGLMVDAEVGNGDHLVWHAELDDAIQTTFQVPATVLYTAHWFAGPHNLEGHAPSLGDEPLYVADYTASGQPDRTPTVLPGWSKVSFWQYTDRGSVPGVAGRCDRDVFFGTEDDLRALCKPADAPVPPVAVVDERVDAFNNLWDLTLDQRWTEERRRSAQRAIVVLKKAEGME